MCIKGYASERVGYAVSSSVIGKRSTAIWPRCMRARCLRHDVAEDRAVITRPMGLYALRLRSRNELQTSVDTE